MKAVFMECLKPIGGMMLEQMKLAEDSKLEVEVCIRSKPDRSPFGTIVLVSSRMWY